MFGLERIVNGLKELFGGSKKNVVYVVLAGENYLGYTGDGKLVEYKTLDNDTRETAFAKQIMRLGLQSYELVPVNYSEAPEGLVEELRKRRMREESVNRPRRGGFSKISDYIGRVILAEREAAAKAAKEADARRKGTTIEVKRKPI